MSYKNYINEIEELEKKKIYVHQLLLTDYIKSNYDYITYEILNLNFFDEDFDNALYIANSFYLKNDGISFDMIGMIGISLAKWNFLSKEDQDTLLNKLWINDEYLNDFLDEYTIEKYAIENQEPVR
ncbi:hypothetical protein [Spiroplasma citri]|uniref:hypothetical protein n=1 Tax=Spiroplasma citri TaxID=2133 RepID=UPI0011BB343A|nr:hypothetical protein [Spiroplasma citri]QED24732.1 hypothetical protein FRX96_04690 [Spiroplasma citri]QJU61673.1 hypothetical protein HHA36_04335 [Spiroplasma citri]